MLERGRPTRGAHSRTRETSEISATLTLTLTPTQVRALGPARPSETSASRLQFAKQLLLEAEAAAEAASLTADERAAKLAQKREAENRRRGRAAYLESLPHWERGAAAARLEADDEAWAAYEAGTGPKPPSEAEVLAQEAASSYAGRCAAPAQPSPHPHRKPGRRARGGSVVRGGCADDGR